jgi:hypothetical protein
LYLNGVSAAPRLVLTQRFFNLIEFNASFSDSWCLVSHIARAVLGANVHCADERVRLDDVKKATQVVALALANQLASQTSAQPAS